MCFVFLWSRSRPSGLGRSSHVVCGEPSYTKTDLQIDTKVCANDWSISASRACHDLVVAVEEVSQRMKAMMDREQSIRHVFELWRIKESRGRRWREREREHISMTRCAEILGIELQSRKRPLAVTVGKRRENSVVGTTKLKRFQRP